MRANEAPHLQAGKLNALPFVIWMSRLDTARTVQIASPTGGETVLATPRIPGLELRIPPNKVIRDRRSGRTCRGCLC